MKAKQKIIAAVALVAIGGFAGISGFQKSESSAITLANVEALTNSESSYPCPGACMEWSGNSGGGIACDCQRYVGKCKRRCP